MLDFANFASLDQPEGNLMDAISRVRYNGSYTIAAKPIKTLELHYTMIQFLMMYVIPHMTSEANSSHSPLFLGRERGKGQFYKL